MFFFFLLIVTHLHIEHSCLHHSLSSFHRFPRVTYYTGQSLILLFLPVYLTLRATCLLIGRETPASVAPPLRRLSSFGGAQRRLRTHGKSSPRKRSVVHLVCQFCLLSLAVFTPTSSTLVLFCLVALFFFLLLLLFFPSSSPLSTSHQRGKKHMDTEGCAF